MALPDFFFFFFFFCPTFFRKSRFPITQKCKTTKYAKKKKKNPTYLPNQKIQGSGTANKQFFKDGPIVCPNDFLPYGKISASWLVMFTYISTGRGSSIGSEFAWHASGPEFDPHVRHILSWRLGHETFLRPFSLFRWFKTSSCQLLAKECALSTGKLPRRLAQEQCG